MWNAYKITGVENRLENRLDLTFYPKIYFCLIYAHYEEEVLTKHLRRSFDKTCTKKSWKFKRLEKRWENRWDLTSSPKLYFWVLYTHYEEVLTKHVRRSLDKFKRVEKRLEKRLDLTFYPKHYFCWKNDQISLYNCIFLTKRTFTLRKKIPEIVTKLRVGKKT